MPYRVYAATYSACPTFLWQTPGPIPSYRHAVMANFFVNWERQQFIKKHMLYDVLNFSIWTRICNFFEFFIGLVILRCRWSPCGATAATDGFGWRSYLRAALPGANTVDYIDGSLRGPSHRVGARASRRRNEELGGWQWNGQPAGRWLSAAVVAICVLEYVVPLGCSWYAARS